jgi:hypothetical protein
MNVNNSNIKPTHHCDSDLGVEFYSKSDYIGRDDNRADSFQDTSSDLDNNETIERKDDGNIVNIYRYKFTEEFIEELFKFSKIYQYSNRKDFKEAWNLWLEDNNGIVDKEVKRLLNLGYKGDIIDKMFKSSRYYFRKKIIEKKEPTKRRVYVVTDKKLLNEIDTHIKLHINSGNFKPSDGFDEFCKENIALLKEQVTMLYKSGITNSDEIKAKIKKTYKNRYFLINK